MSTRVTTKETCLNCGEEYDTFAAPGYCSKECQHKSTGGDILRHLEHDHRVCSACFRWIKETERPTDDYIRSNRGTVDPMAIVGFQYETPHADYGTKEIRHIPRQVETTIVCECGSHHKDDYLRNMNLRDTIKRFLRAFYRLRDEGQHDKEIDTETLCEALIDGKGWESAVGKAISEG